MIGSKRGEQRVYGVMWVSGAGVVKEEQVGRKKDSAGAVEGASGI